MGAAVAGSWVSKASLYPFIFEEAQYALGFVLIFFFFSYSTLGTIQINCNISALCFQI
jgi:hypothetical protein